jgi:hypothetical protein
MATPTQNHLDTDKKCTVVHIGHAANAFIGTSDENQVTISNYYDIGAEFLLRPNSRELAEKSAKACEAGCCNDKIRYWMSFPQRNTLKDKAEEINSDLTKVDLAEIDEICYADCSSFMTLCAVIGGAKFDYYSDGNNAPTTSSMRTWFTSKHDYEEYTEPKYLKGTEYLQRGDILVKPGSHTVMVLDNGNKALVSDTPLEDVTTTKIITNISEIGSDYIKAKLKVKKVYNGEENDGLSEEELQLYTWKYKVIPITGNSSEDILEDIVLTTANREISIIGLSPNTSYILKIIATEIDGEVEISSASIVFTTIQAYPSAVKNLNVVMNSSKDLFYLTLNSPDSWGNASLSKCYRLHLIVNGKSVKHNDTILNIGNTYANTPIKISDITSDILFKSNDVIQIGVQPGLKDGNTFIFDLRAFRCSNPIYIEPALKQITNVFVKLSNGFKQAIIHHKEVN